MYRAAPAHMQRDYGLCIEHMGDATLLSIPGIDHPLLNRAWLSSPDPEPERLAAIARRFHTLGAERFIVHTQRAPDLDGGGSGLAQFRRKWVKLVGRVQPNAPAADCELPIDVARAGDAAVCGQMYCDGFDLPDAAASLFAAVIGRRGWHVFVARDSAGDAVGIGYLFTRGHAAYLGGAATARAHRGRGVQRAMLAARVETAAAVGCEWIASETGEPTPGDPQHSQRNMERYGLEVVGYTVNLVPVRMTWSHGVDHRVQATS